MAVTFGIWCGLTVLEGPTVMGIFLGLWTGLIAANGWAVMLMMLSWLAYLLVAPASADFMARLEFCLEVWVWG